MGIGKADRATACRTTAGIHIAGHQIQLGRIDDRDRAIDRSHVDLAQLQGPVAVVGEAELGLPLEGHHLAVAGAEDLARERDVAPAAGNVVEGDRLAGGIHIARQGQGAAGGAAETDAIDWIAGPVDQAAGARGGEVGRHLHGDIRQTRLDQAIDIEIQGIDAYRSPRQDGAICIARSLVNRRRHLTIGLGQGGGGAGVGARIGARTDGGSIEDLSLQGIAIHHRGGIKAGVEPGVTVEHEVAGGTDRHRIPIHRAAHQDAAHGVGEAHRTRGVGNCAQHIEIGRQWRLGSTGQADVLQRVLLDRHAGHRGLDLADRRAAHPAGAVYIDATGGEHGVGAVHRGHHIGSADLRVSQGQDQRSAVVDGDIGVGVGSEIAGGRAAAEGLAAHGHGTAAAAGLQEDRAGGGVEIRQLQHQPEDVLLNHAGGIQQAEAAGLLGHRLQLADVARLVRRGIGVLVDQLIELLGLVGQVAAQVGEHQLGLARGTGPEAGGQHHRHLIRQLRRIAGIGGGRGRRRRQQLIGVGHARVGAEGADLGGGEGRPRHQGGAQGRG